MASMRREPRCALSNGFQARSVFAQAVQTCVQNAQQGPANHLGFCQLSVGCHALCGVGPNDTPGASRHHRCMHRAAHHLICSNQPLGEIAAWARASVQAAGDACDVVGCDLAMNHLEQQRIDSVLVDVDSFDASAVSLLSTLWKFQCTAPVWLASRRHGRSERLLRLCSAQSAPRAAAFARRSEAAVSLCSLNALSATSLLALHQLSRQGQGA
jgi:hypothetical protein